jgi:SnoaL-like protein
MARIDRAAAEKWLIAYVRAWETYDPEAIGDLFSQDATYAFHPYDEPLRGREAIVESWLKDQDPPGTYAATYQPIAVDGDVVVAHGRSRYFSDATQSTQEREYDNIFVLEFDGAGRCREFREWYFRPPGQKEPS